MKTFYKTLKILAIMLPGIFTYHFLFNLFSTIDAIAPAWLIALAGAVYVSAWTYKKVDDLGEEAPKKKAKSRRVRVVMTQKKADELKKLGVI